MKKEDVIEFFDRCAPTWDAEMIKNDEIIDNLQKSRKPCKCFKKTTPKINYFC